MKKLLVILFISIVVPLFWNYESEMDQSTDCYLMAEPIEIINHEEIYIEDNEQEPDAFEMAQKDYLAAMDRLDSITDRQQWFLEYKQIINEYVELVDSPETIYDYFTDDELKLLFQTVETETYDCDFDSKVNIANVIFNRLTNGNFGETLEEVITREKQFSYWRETISEDTILATMYAFEFEDTTSGSLFFHSNEKTDIFCNAIYVFTDNAGHHFYK